MQTQPTRRHALPDGLVQQCRLRQRVAVDDDVVRIPFKRDTGMMLRHPLVEHTVQKEIGQQRADDPALRCPSLRQLAGAIR